MQSGYKLVQLVNGTWSVHSLAEEETFHPVVGPVAEAEALYVKQLKLPERIASTTGEFVIWDVGLGAAANAITVLRSARSLSTPMRLLSFDRTLEPLRFALQHRQSLGYFREYENIVGKLLEQPVIQFSNGTQSVQWEVKVADFPTSLHRAAASDFPKPHAILFDAFSPAANPAMWTMPLFTQIFKLLDPKRPCALPTYSRSTLLRVTLLLAGFYVGAGHATGEKEETTIAANSLELIDQPLDRRWLKRARNSTSAEPLIEALYRQAPLSESNWKKLCDHAQFAVGAS